MLKRITLLFFLFCVGTDFSLSAQELTGLEGSIYGGVVNTGVQPAAGANMPYRWDVNIFSINSFWNNNILSFSPTQWQWVGDSLDLKGHFITGNGKRWATVQADVHLLNFLFRWPHRNDWVIGAGWNLHSRTYPDRLNFQYEDSMKTMSSFLAANAFNKMQQGRAVTQEWMEWYITASKVLIDDRNSRLSVGGTVKLLKGIGAVVMDLDEVSVGLQKSGNRQAVVFTAASGRYGYSQNLEELSNDQGAGETLRTLSQGASFSPALDVGISYVVRKPIVIAGFTNDDPAAYDWKVEAALTDIGRLKYPLGNQSININGLKGQPEVERFAHLFDSLSTVNQFNDSLKTMANITPWSGSFSVSLPTALRINVDKNLGSHFYLNGRMVVDMAFLNLGVDYKTRQTSYLMLTPRWEIKRVGVYAPLYVDVHGSFMAGAALRLGPLIAGVHDFRWLFHNSRGGGAYIGLVIRGLLKERDECPTF